VGKKIDLAGQVFERLTCIDSFSIRSPSGTMRVKWNCICECGNLVQVRPRDLRSGHTKSCGCYRDEQNSIREITL